MNLQKTKPLSEIYQREEDFSSDFKDAETEADVGTRRADIVAIGEGGTIWQSRLGLLGQT